MLAKRFDIDGPLLITSPVYQDKRGYFMESFHAHRLIDVIGYDPRFVQDNLSNSFKTGTLRGLHLQQPPFAQHKLIQCVTGAVLDVIVDVRKGSPTYGQHITVELSAEDGHALWIPSGFLHGFVTRQDKTIVIYKTSAHFDTDSDISVCWDDPDLGISWGLDQPPQLSRKDADAIKFADFDSPFSIDT